MNLQAEKLGLIEWITKLNNSKIIEKLRGIKEDYVESEDWWNELTKEELESINRGLRYIEEGKVHSHENVKNPLTFSRTDKSKEIKEKTVLCFISLLRFMLRATLVKTLLPHLQASTQRLMLQLTKKPNFCQHT